MATVYLAHDLKHDRDVAIKVLKPELGAVLGAERFLSEIKVTANLQHPNLLPLFDSGEADGLLFYVMPFIEGETLRARLQREQQLPVDETIRLISLIAGALDFAHARGVVHRDLKPENILLQAGQPIVADFGIALAISNAGGERVTQTGLSLGTPHYMSPEQAAGDRDVTARSDQYALAALTYEMLTGEPPHTGATAQVIIARLMTEVPRSMRTARPSVTTAVDNAVLRALSKVPADRFASCGEFARALAITDAAAVPRIAPAQSRSRVTRVVVAITAVACIVAIAGAWWRMRDRALASAALSANVQLTRAVGLEEFPTIAPDGKTVAYLASSATDSVPHVELRRTDGGDAVHIAGMSMPTSWSPSGDRLLISGPRGMESRPALGGPGTIIDARALFACWSPDGAHIAYVKGDSLFVRASTGGTPRFVTSAAKMHSPAWSPDGRFIAFVLGNRDYFLNYNIASSQIRLVSANGGATVPLTSEDGTSISPTWAPDSRRLLMVSAQSGARDVYQINIGDDGHPRGAPVRISTGLNPSLISLSSDGTRLAYSVATYNTAVYKALIPKTGWISSRVAQEPVTNDREVTEGIDISRDGKWMVFDSNRQGVTQIFRTPLQGGPVEQLTHGASNAFNPSISPDGREVAYHALSGGLRRVFVIAAEDGTPTQVSSGLAPDERNVSWSPDGNMLAWMVNTTGYAGGPTPFYQVQTATRIAAGRWSAPRVIAFNGRLLDIAWLDQGTTMLGFDASWHAVAQPVVGGEGTRMTAPAIDSTFAGTGTATRSSDGRFLYVYYRSAAFRTPRSGVVEYRVADGSLREVLRFDERARQHSMTSNRVAEHDGWLYFTLTDFQSDVWVATVTGLSK